MTSSYGVGVERLTSRHYAILDLAIAGATNTEIAEKVKMSRAQVGIIQNSPCFKHQFALRRKLVEEKNDEKQAISLDKTRTMLESSALMAAEKIVHHINSSDDKTSLRAAESILDRTGYPKETKVEGNKVGLTIVLDNKQMVTLNETLVMVDGVSAESEINGPLTSVGVVSPDIQADSATPHVQTMEK